jgi:hypothetical protein
MIEGKLRLATVGGEARQFVAESGTGHLFDTMYCAVGAMISKTAKIEATFEILPGVATAPEFAG